MRNGWMTTSVLVAALASRAVAADDDGPVEIFRARVVDAASDADVERLRDDLLALGRGAFSEGVLTSQGNTVVGSYRGHLRSLLAASLSDADLVGEIRAARDDFSEPAERLETLLVNLRGRRGLGAAVVAEGALGVATAAAADDLATVAADDLLDGDSVLATTLLSTPALARRAAESLAEENYSTGLCFVADVLTREVRVPDAARDALAGLDLNLGDIRLARPLGAERRAQLVRVARDDPDPALRAAAAHVLHFANTDEGTAAAYEAKEHARSHRIWLDEWNWLGRTALPPVDLPLRPALRARAAGAWMYLSHVGANDDPLLAESMAAELRAYYHAMVSDRARGALVRALEELAYRFVDSYRAARPRIVPAFAALLDDWDRGNEEAGASLRVLERHVAASLRNALLRGEQPDRRRQFGTAESVVFALLPEHAPGDATRAASIATWLDADPGHLYDGRVRSKLAMWGQDQLPVLLAAYPEESLRTMLMAPPMQEARIDNESQPRHDPTGSIARRPLLEFLAADPRHATRLQDESLWRSWPASDRRHAGALLHRVLCEGAGVTNDPVLADDAFALGFVEDAFGDDSAPIPGDPALAFAARVFAGIDARPELRARLSDGDAGDDDITFLNGLSLDAATFAGLVEVLEQDADPRASMVAARLLAATGRGDALDQVFAADAWLACGTVFSTSTWSDDVAHLVHDDETRDAVLRYVAAPGGLARERVGAFDTLVGLDWVDELFDDAPEELVIARLAREIQALGTWMRSEFATLDADVAEGVARAWMVLPTEELPDDRREAAETWVRSTLDDALELFPDGGPKRRMRADLAATRDTE